MIPISRDFPVVIMTIPSFYLYHNSQFYVYSPDIFLSHPIFSPDSPFPVFKTNLTIPSISTKPPRKMTKPYQTWGIGVDTPRVKVASN